MKKISLFYQFVLVVLVVIFTCAAWSAGEGDSKKNEAAKPACAATVSAAEESNDLFLEEIRGEAALKWVKEQNAKTLARLEGDARYEPLRKKFLDVLDAKDKLPSLRISKGVIYNFWQDAENPKGLYRRIPLARYLKGDRNWEVLLDIDKLAKAEDKSWVYGGATPYKDRILFHLSDGGKDAEEVREFDLVEKKFVAGGFALPEGKHNVQWVNDNTLLVGLANEGEVTESGYPMTARFWKRGTDVYKAPVVFRGEFEDVSAGGEVIRYEEDGEVKHIGFYRRTDFLSQKSFIKTRRGLIELAVPANSDSFIDDGFLYLKIKSDWEVGGNTFVLGSLIRIKLDEFLNGRRNFDVVFQPDNRRVLASYATYKGRIFLGLMIDVNTRWVELTKSGGVWSEKDLALPENSEISLYSLSEKDGVAIFAASNFLQPTTRYLYDLNAGTIQPLEKAPDRFDASPYKIEQHFATSKDGTKVPYYMVARKDLVLDGKNPVIIYGYGGFEVSLTPYYSSLLGLGWLEQGERGGVYVMANIRGGGEYGPAWHQAALLDKRQRAYDDFQAVAEDLQARKVSSSLTTGIEGGSNGGLLTGVSVTQRPKLYNAAVIEVPLLDMLRYHEMKPGPGKSWIAELGNPNDPVMRAFWLARSPHQNVFPDEEYPEVFFMGSTADDRVHPGHPRRMAHKMAEQGHPFLFFENNEGGHGGTAENPQEAKWYALQYVYFMQKLMDEQALADKKPK